MMSIGWEEMTSLKRPLRLIAVLWTLHRATSSVRFAGAMSKAIATRCLTLANATDLSASFITSALSTGLNRRCKRRKREI